eukprot:2053969-Rhodomonas_salina.2
MLPKVPQGITAEDGGYAPTSRKVLGCRPRVLSYKAKVLGHGTRAIVLGYGPTPCRRYRRGSQPRTEPGSIIAELSTGHRVGSA